MELMLNSNFTNGSKILADSLNNSFIDDINENKDYVKDLYSCIVIMLCSHINLNSESFTAVCFDDIAEVAKRLHIMANHK